MSEKSLQTTVLKVSLTFDPKALVEWAKNQRGTCCNNPAHDPEHLDWMEPELTAQSILAHALLGAVGEITEHGSVTTLETGIPEEIAQRLNDEYGETLRQSQLPALGKEG